MVFCAPRGRAMLVPVTQRLRSVLTAATALAVLAGVAAPATAQPSHPNPRVAFDLQAHRGGMAERTESSLTAFDHALSVGVSTLELDTQITQDGKVVVTHDRKTNPEVCADTAPVAPGDPEYPYVGKYVKDLTLTQLQTLDCGFQQRPGYPDQVPTSGSRMLELSDVFDLVKQRKARHVDLNIETKVEAGAPEETAPRAEFVRLVHREIERSGLRRQVAVQSFDWGALREMNRLDPRIPLVALTNHDFLEVDEPGVSPWTGGVDVDDFGGDFVAAADSLPGVTTLSPVATIPQDCSVASADCEPYVTRDMVRRAHDRGLGVVPWTVDDPATFRHLLETGVDGIITNHPTRAGALLSEAGYKLPKPVR